MKDLATQCLISFSKYRHIVTAVSIHVYCYTDKPIHADSTLPTIAYMYGVWWENGHMAAGDSKTGGGHFCTVRSRLIFPIILS